MKQLELYNFQGTNIDDRNRNLWMTLTTEFPSIFILESLESNYYTNFKEKFTTIHIDKNNQSSASFTHELLHIEFKLRNKITIGQDLSRLISKEKKLNYIFSKGLEDHLTNILEHVKFFNRFIELGFSEKDFLSDYEVSKISDAEIEFIKLHFKRQEIFDKDCIDFYIGNFFGMKACPNKNFNYEKYFNELKSIDLLLFQILDRFWLSWIEYDIQNNSKKNWIFFERPRYLDFLELFIHELKVWSKPKSII